MDLIVEQPQEDPMLTPIHHIHKAILLMEDPYLQEHLEDHRTNVLITLKNGLEKIRRLIYQENMLERNHTSETVSEREVLIEDNQL